MKFRWLFIILLSLAAVRPLATPGWFPMHDDVQVARVVAMSRSLADGQIPVRWVSDLGYGYGYPLFNFYGPLPYYAGGVIALLTGDPLGATKIMMAVGMVLAAVSMFALAARLLPFWAAAALSMLYMYAPYHGTQLFVRGAVGELWAYGFLPLVVAGALGNVPLGIVGLFGVITSHTITGPIVVGLLLVASFFRFRTVLPILGFGLALSAFFWLPAFAEMGSTSVAGQIGGGADFRDHFVCARQLWDSALGYGGSTPGCIDGMSFKIGKLQILLAGLGLAAAQTPLGMIGAALAIGSVFLMTPLSRGLWELMPFAAFIQYPWRFLSFASLGLVLLAPGLWQRVRGRAGVFAGAAVIVLAVWTNAESFVPQTIYPAASSDFQTEYELRFRASRISDEYMAPDFVRPSTEADVVRGKLPGSSIRRTYEVRGDGGSNVVVPLAYFPGWTYTVDGVAADPKVEAGLPVFTLAPGDHTIEAQLTNTPVRAAGNAISLAALVVLGVIYAKNKKTFA